MDVDEPSADRSRSNTPRSDTGAVCPQRIRRRALRTSAHLWNAGIKDNMVNAMGTIVTRGYADTLLGIPSTTPRTRRRAASATAP